MLRETAEMRAREREDYEPLVTLQADADGNYQVTSDPIDSLGGPDEEEAYDTDDCRQIVFLDARGLLRAR